MTLRAGMDTPMQRDALADEIKRLRAENDKLREIARSFVALWSITYAYGQDAPTWKHLIDEHYDLLAELGARMDDFVRWSHKP